MKKNFTTLFIIGALIVFSASNVFSQIDGLDVTKYYMIINNNTSGYTRNAIGIDAADIALPGALIQQQEPTGADGHLWQIIEITDSTYYFVNKLSGMYIGGSRDWRDLNPFWDGDPTASGITSEEKDAQLTVPRFNWNGQHRGVVQNAKDEADETQIWQPTLFPGTSSIGDTILYRMTLKMNLADSGFSFNIWERRVLPGYKNICIFPGVKESSLYTDYKSLYAWRFQKTDIEVEFESVQDVTANNFDIYAANGHITIKGDIINQTIEVYSILGAKIYSALATASELNFELNKGVYIVKAGNSVSKIIVQ